MKRKFWSPLASAVFAALLFVSAPALAQSLGAAQSFAILGGSAVNANGPMSVINGDVGVSPGSSITGFPASATVTPPFSTHITDGPANSARAATLALYNSLAGMGGATPILPGLNGQVLGPGIYTTGAALLVTGGTLTLTGAGTYIFQVTSSLTTGVGSNVVLNGVDPCNVFWQVTSLATLDGATFAGNVLAQTGVHLGTGASLTGRALAAAAGDVTMAGSNTVGGCSAAVPAQLGLVKTVNNAGGGTATAGQFTLTATGPTVISGPAPVAATNAPVGVYTLTETGPAGYTAGLFSCSGGGTLVGNQLTVGVADAGNTITCTIVNTFSAAVPAQLGLVKTVNNAGGGTATAGQFTLTATGPTVISGPAPVAATNAPVGVYTLTETGPAGYTAGLFSCSGGGTLVGNQLTIGVADAGNTITCTIINTFVSVSVNSIPTLSEWGMIILAGLLALFGFVAVRRQAR